MKKITELTAELAAPAIAEQSCTLWDVEYVKEAGTWYLRVLLDKEGGVDILDCESVSRKLSDLLYRAQDGRKEFAGHLKAYDEQSGAVTSTMGAQELTFEKKDVALVRLRVEF